MIYNIEQVIDDGETVEDNDNNNGNNVATPMDVVLNPLHSTSDEKNQNQKENEENENEIRSSDLHSVVSALSLISGSDDEQVLKAEEIEIRLSAKRFAKSIKVYGFIIKAVLIVGLLGVGVCVRNLVVEEFGFLVYLIQLLLVLPVVTNAGFGLWCNKMNRIAWVELHGLFNIILMMLITFVGTVTIIFRSVPIMESGVEELLRITWEALHDQSGSSVNAYDVLMSIQENGNCCGFDDKSDLPLMPCPPTSEIGCRGKMTDDFTSANFWFMFFGFMIAICLAISTVFVHRLRKFSRHHMKQHNKVKNTIDMDNIHLLDACISFQAAYRGWRDRARAIRLREVQAWNELRGKRFRMQVLVHSFAILYCIFMLYINLLYGIKFSGSVADSWIESSLIGLALDILLQQPLVIVLKATFEHIISLRKKIMNNF
eukprot:TRINITY_DN4942_c0_g2_i2.p1 TRINITY_DN4942_c0_g2~~TRINITY_DN4942_c0_g2_i2.p1  ORF type:complete len:429 (-),score=124.63 TRINITY_DN4942_c0_g2_i2:809-2095(-)